MIVEEAVGSGPLGGHVAESSHARGCRALASSGIFPLKWPGDRFVWPNRANLTGQPIFALDDPTKGT